MEEGAHIWLRSPKSEWGWLPARITKKEIVPCKTKKHKTVQTDRPTAPSGGSGRASPAGGGDKPKSAAIKALEEERRKALQTIMRNRSLEKDERKKQMDEVKDNFAKLTAEAEAAGGGAAPAADEPEKPKEPQLDENTVIQLTIVDDYSGLSDESKVKIKSTVSTTSGYGRGVSGFYANAERFKTIVLIDHIQAREEHPDIKLRNTPTSDSASGIQFYGAQVNPMLSSRSLSTNNGNHMPNPAVGQPATRINDKITGGVDDLIGLTHLHEPAILHALRLRYDADIIYTNTGPILLAINPFKVS